MHRCLQFQAMFWGGDRNTLVGKADPDGRRHLRNMFPMARKAYDAQDKPPLFEGYSGWQEQSQLHVRQPHATNTGMGQDFRQERQGGP